MWEENLGKIIISGVDKIGKLFIFPLYVCRNYPTFVSMFDSMELIGVVQNLYEISFSYLFQKEDSNFIFLFK